MPLSPLIELLGSIRSGKTNVLEFGVDQVEVPIFPPNTVVTIGVAPAPYYAVIGYRLSGQAIPNAFVVETLISAYVAYNLTLTGDIIDQGANYFYVQTPNISSWLRITNQTALNQYIVFNSWWLGAATRDDLEYALGVLAEYTGLDAYVNRQEVRR